MNESTWMGSYMIAFIIFMLPVEIRYQMKPFAKRYYFLTLLLMTLIYCLIVVCFSHEWQKPLRWILSQLLVLSGIFFMEEIGNGIADFWRRICKRAR